jgi:hypothetical protein
MKKLPTTMTRDEVIEAAKTLTMNDLGDIACSIVVLRITGHDDTAAIFEQRYIELVGEPFSLKSLHEAGRKC